MYTLPSHAAISAYQSHDQDAVVASRALQIQQVCSLGWGRSVGWKDLELFTRLQVLTTR